MFPKSGVYILEHDLQKAIEMSKKSTSGLMRGLITHFYSRERLAASSAKKGINLQIRDAVIGIIKITTVRKIIHNYHIDLAQKTPRDENI